MPKRGRSEGDIEEEGTLTKVERSAESGRRFEAYVKQWAAGVAGALEQRPSQLPPLADVSTILSLSTIITTLRGPAGATPSLVPPAPSPQGRDEGLGPLAGTTRTPSRAGTGVVYDDSMMKHVSADPKDFERPARLRRTIDHLHAVGLLERCVRLKARMAKTRELRRVHTREHIDFVDQLDFFMNLKKEESLPVGQDLYACEHTSEAARYAAGSVVEAARAVVRGEVANAFAIVRPPGHHAGPDTPSGFCFYNNVAVAARAAQAELAAMMEGSGTDGGATEVSCAPPSPSITLPASAPANAAGGDLANAKPHILILDWDVHHCDGTEKVFYEDESVLVISIHQYGSGRGHVLRKTPSAATPATGGAAAATTRASAQEEVTVEALADLMTTEELPGASGEESANGGRSTTEVAPVTAGRRRAVVDYNKLAEELNLHDDKAAAAALGVNLSSVSSSSSSGSSESSTSDGGSADRGDMPRYAGDTEGLSFDDLAAAPHPPQSDGAEEEGDLFYPGTGHLGRMGGERNEAAQGRNINVPWPTHGFGDLEYLRVVQEIVIPAAHEFQPILVLVSCGFDSARGDLLGSMNLSASGFYSMTKLLSAHFPRLVVALEGGYNVSNVARCSEAVMRALLEDSLSTTGGAAISSLPPSRMLWCQTSGLVDTLRSQLSPYWKCFSVSDA